MSFSFRPIFSLPSTTRTHQVCLGFDAVWAYVATTHELWRIDHAFLSSSHRERVPIEKGEIQHLDILGSDVYLLKFTLNDGTGSVLLRSRDHGNSFHSIDAGLVAGEDGYRVKLAPTRMVVRNGFIFVNAGGGRNVFVSDDDGYSWLVLNGAFSSSVCYHGKFLIHGNSMLIGGECPLDMAYLMKGTLLKDFKGWQTVPHSVAPADLGNRNIQFFESFEHWGLLLAGVEGGLLSSGTDGESWDWRIREDDSGETYPYIQHVACLPSLPDTAFVGGFDKAKNSAPYLALTNDRGKSWTDVSHALYGVATQPRNAFVLTTHPDGRLLVAVQDNASADIVFAELIR